MKLMFMHLIIQTYCYRWAVNTVTMMSTRLVKHINVFELPSFCMLLVKPQDSMQSLTYVCMYRPMKHLI